ncbi:hypothetical protein BJ138DRAFT_1090147 [Hygrophoropsis aurantiaca]|uniref:Uncharacterized protein n=1 Tax=Hygrophoropsis aurantiaca TaxID=72124 RepID=A0ACB8A7L9_9AGAM|nr:hypothetical protein BJ138DRAFT_1090147 [Hygrophoropsis aurantiaca]
MSMSVSEPVAEGDTDGDELVGSRVHGGDEGAEDSASDEETIEDEAAEERDDEDDGDSSNDDDEGDEDGDDDEDDDDEDGSDSGDDDDDDEPILKYSRIGNAVPDLLKKDSASALASASSILALGTHSGLIHIITLDGRRLKSFKPHQATVTALTLTANASHVASASLDGHVVVHALSLGSSPPPSSDSNIDLDTRRPVRGVALSPGFGRRGSRGLVWGGMAGRVTLREKGWLGYSDTVLHEGEGPVWCVAWRGRVVVWANDRGIRMYDTQTQTLLPCIPRPPSSPRADLFKCTLHWQDDATLLAAWADQVSIVHVKPQSQTNAQPQPQPQNPTPSISVSVTAAFQMDCMIAGVVPYPPPHTAPTTPLHSLLVLAYTPPRALLPPSQKESDDPTQVLTDDVSVQKRGKAGRPELRVVVASHAHDTEITETPDAALGVAGYERWGCNDYVLVDASAGVFASSSGLGPNSIPSASTSTSTQTQPRYILLAPHDLVFVRPRDAHDRVHWLVERGRWEEALVVAEGLEASGVEHTAEGEGKLDARTVGEMYIKYLIGVGAFVSARAGLGSDARKWEELVFVFAQAGEIGAIIPYIPTTSPYLGRVAYELVLAHLMAHDRAALLRTIRAWPKTLYDVPAVIVAVQAELDRVSVATSGRLLQGGDKVLLMESLVDLYTANHQPGKALRYLLRLPRRAPDVTGESTITGERDVSAAAAQRDVFALIREHGLYADVRDEVGLLVEYEERARGDIGKEHGEMDDGGAGEVNGGGAGEKDEAGVIESGVKEGGIKEGGVYESEAITLLVEHTHSIPIARVVQQLRPRPVYLFRYLDALAHKDPHLVADFADLQVTLFAEHAPARLIDYLRTSTYYNLEAAYRVCKSRDMVPEMVFLLGRVGNNKKALMLIIERLGDVNRAIEFAKEQSDDDLWEDLLKYSETRPAFIRTLLLTVGAEIDPVRLLRRIKNGLEIPGLKDALIKILHDFHLTASLLEGCRAILDGDGRELAGKRRGGQVGGFFFGGANLKTLCPICTQPLLRAPQPQDMLLLFLCRHVVHASCVPGLALDDLGDDGRGSVGTGAGVRGNAISAKIAFASVVRAKIQHGCPVCHKKGEGDLSSAF